MSTRNSVESSSNDHCMIAGWYKLVPGVTLQGGVTAQGSNTILPVLLSSYHCSQKVDKTNAAVVLVALHLGVPKGGGPSRTARTIVGTNYLALKWDVKGVQLVPGLWMTVG